MKRRNLKGIYLLIYQANTLLVYTGFHTRYQVPFYLWQIKPALKLCKVTKCYEEDCGKGLIT